MEKFEYKTIRKVLYGFDAEVPRTVILTPISAIFDELATNIKIKIENNGWWKSVNGNFREVDILIIKTPQYTGVIDAVISLEQTSNLFLFGYCGSLDKRYDIGDIVFAEKAVRGNDQISSNMQSTIDRVIVGNINSFLDLYENKNCVNCIDMETFYFYKYAQRVSQNYCSFLIVTDIPSVHGKRFFEINKKEYLQSLKKLPDIIEAHLKGTNIGL